MCSRVHYVSSFQPRARGPNVGSEIDEYVQKFPRFKRFHSATDRFSLLVVCELTTVKLRFGIRMPCDRSVDSVPPPLLPHPYVKHNVRSTGS